MVDSGSSPGAALHLVPATPIRQRRRLVLVHLPVHASWFSQSETHFSIVQRTVLGPKDFAALRARHDLGVGRVGNAGAWRPRVFGALLSCRSTPRPLCRSLSGLEELLMTSEGSWNNKRAGAASKSRSWRRNAEWPSIFSS